MKFVCGLVVGCSVLSLVPVTGFAAGTYYNGNYQSAQRTRYNSQSYANQQRYNNNYNQVRNYSNYNNSYANRNTGGQSAVRANPNAKVNVGQKNGGWNAQNTGQITSGTDETQLGGYLNAGISHEFATWNFDMKNAGSKLHYDNIGWNVLDVSGGYVFSSGNTKIALTGGVRYGMQSGDSSMVDDDMTNGGFLITEWVDADNNFIGDEIGHAVSVGTSSGGKMLGLYAGIGVPDFFKIGKLRITPSVGYRYFNYKLETKSNYGLSVDTAACYSIDGSDEIQCNPALIIKYSNGQSGILWDVYDDDEDGYWDIAGATGVNPGDTYYFEQPGTSHSYKVDWTGPFVAFDMDYLINQSNAVSGRMELGLPSYKSTGDQPYRFDWAHPKSVEDKAGMGDAYHLGLSANWTTALTDAVNLSIGFSYDYYTVSGADAKTYLNNDYYYGIYDTILEAWQNAGYTETQMLNSETGDPTAIAIATLYTECPNGVCTDSGEIDSVYKSLGIRIGVNARF